ncbi:MAG: N-acyl homoserine lactonase family protein [Armatimonadota bacterium]
MSAVYEIHPLKVGEVVEPEPRIFYLGDCSKTIRLGNFFFLITGEGQNILVDTGVTKSDGDRFNPSMLQRPDEDPLVQLAQRGVEPDSIRIVIASHLHWDHVSPVVDKLRGAKVCVNPRELEMVLSPPHPWFAQFVYRDVIDRLLDEGRILETLDGDEVAPGVRILATPGHTFGGQSVVVDTAQGRAVITGDVCFTYRNLEEDIPGGFNCNLVECFASLARIRAAADIVLPSHDLALLEKFPDGVK